MEDRSLKKVIAKTEYEKGKAYLKDLEKNTQSPKYYYRIAASVIVLLGLSLAFIFFNKKESANDLYAQYFEPYKNVISPKYRGQNGNDAISKAMTLYESHQYKKALQAIDKLLTQKTEDSLKLKFYKANLLLQLNNSLDEAETLLTQNINSSNEWEDKNLWYLTLVHLKKNEPEKALKVLEKMDAKKLSLYTKKRARLKKQLLDYKQ